MMFQMSIEGVRIRRTNEDVKEFLVTCKALVWDGLHISIGFSIEMQFAAASARRL